MDLSLGGGETWLLIPLTLGFTSVSGIIKSSQENWWSANGPARVTVRMNCKNELCHLRCFEPWSFCSFSCWEGMLYILCRRISRFGMFHDQGRILSCQCTPHAGRELPDSRNEEEYLTRLFLAGQLCMQRSLVLFQAGSWEFQGPMALEQLGLSPCKSC